MKKILKSLSNELTQLKDSYQTYSKMLKRSDELVSSVSGILEDLKSNKSHPTTTLTSNDKVTDEKLKSIYDILHKKMALIVTKHPLTLLEKKEKVIAVSEPIIFSCESVTIRAGDDLRVSIPFSLVATPKTLTNMIKEVFTIKWNFQVIQQSNDMSMNSKSNIDIGFSILELQSNGSLPQLVAYQRYALQQQGHIDVNNFDINDKNFSRTRLSLVILFDNSYSWYRSKQLKYWISVESKIIENCVTNINSLMNLETNDDMVEEKQQEEETHEISMGIEESIFEVLQDSIDFLLLSN